MERIMRLPVRWIGPHTTRHHSFHLPGPRQMSLVSGSWLIDSAPQSDKVAGEQRGAAGKLSFGTVTIRNTGDAL